MNSKASFAELDLGSAKPTSVEMQTIEVELSHDHLLGDYAKAFVREAYRVNPLRAQQVDLNDQELVQYAQYLLYQRVLCVRGECKDFRKLKILYIPAFLQYALSMIGQVIIRDKGIRLVPTCEDLNGFGYSDAVLVSNKVGAFEDDLQIVQDAMPRDISGDRDVMSTALIAGYVRSMEKVDHVSATYVTAFLGMKLKEELAFATLYRVQYDDVAFIASALASHRGLFQ